MKIEGAVLLQLLGYKGHAIADVIGPTYKGLESLRARAEYKIRIAQLHKEALARMDAAIYAAQISPDEIRARALRMIKNPLSFRLRQMFPDANRIESSRNLSEIEPMH